MPTRWVPKEMRLAPTLDDCLRPGPPQPRHALLSYHCRGYVRQQENFVLGLDPAIRAAERPELLNRLGYATWAGLGRVESPRQFRRQIDLAGPAA